APLLPPCQPRAVRSAQLDDQRKKCLVYSRLLVRGLSYSSAATGPDPRPRAPRPSFVQGGHVGLRPPFVRLLFAGLHSLFNPLKVCHPARSEGSAFSLELELAASSCFLGPPTPSPDRKST